MDETDLARLFPGWTRAPGRPAPGGGHRLPALGNWLYRLECCRRSRLRGLEDLAAGPPGVGPRADGGGIFWLYRLAVDPETPGPPPRPGLVAAAWLPPPWVTGRDPAGTPGQGVPPRCILEALELAAGACASGRAGSWLGAWCSLCGDVPWDEESDLPIDHLRHGGYLVGEWWNRVGDRPVNPELLRLLL